MCAHEQETSKGEHCAVHSSSQPTWGRLSCGDHWCQLGIRLSPCLGASTKGYTVVHNQKGRRYRHAGSDGKRHILDIQRVQLHKGLPLFLGSADDIAELLDNVQQLVNPEARAKIRRSI
ncbi:hypothetical protein GOP47_0004233 [Adiantum capillus-veneris]|uniref:Uncharacterized protein n=1 Tax=Adiantum capillus-veneris TaxID=13818 RepID=A0A9D4V7W1_ADICA|nr:hypothetical protein GOP47_0004233 [Adiantum capillus-veneris]